MGKFHNSKKAGNVPKKKKKKKNSMTTNGKRQHETQGSTG